MKIMSSKLDSKISRHITEHEGKLESVGIGFGFRDGEGRIGLSFTSDTRNVAIDIPFDELDSIIKQYKEYQKKYPVEIEKGRKKS